MMKVLILGVASVQADAILELKKMGIQTYACAQADDGPGSKAADYFEMINFMDQNKVIDFIKENQIDCVYSVGSDMAMPIASSISEKIGLPYFVSSESAIICNNKNKMREFLGMEFKGNIKYQIINSINDNIELEYPFIMKPADSQGQRGVRLIHGHSEYLENYPISRKYSRSGLVILEEYIEGPEISVNAYFIDGKTAFIVSSDRITWTGFPGGLIHKHIVPAKSVNAEIDMAINDLVSRTAKKLGISNGPLYFQIKLNRNEPVIIEVTPRLDGCHMWKVLQNFTGVNLLKLTFEHLLFNCIDEIKKYIESDEAYALEFLCEAPNQEIDYSKFSIPDEAICSFSYYKNGDIIRPINGQFEKVGYYIIKSRDDK